MKVGRISLTSATKLQVLKDAKLLKSGAVKEVVWEFSTSQVTGKGGPTPQLLNLLQQNGIKVIINP